MGPGRGQKVEEVVYLLALWLLLLPEDAVQKFCENMDLSNV